MQITNNANLRDAIVRAVVNDPYPTRGTGDISVTRLIGPPQIRILERRHRDELTEDASDRIWALVGQVAHGILERAESVAITEERLFAELEGWTLSGQFDRLALLPDGRLQDYKVTSGWACLDGPKPEWTAQLNALRWLAAINDYPGIERLEIVAILRDWSRGKAKAGGNYPSQQVRVLPVPLWSLAQTRDYLIDRVHLHQLAETCVRTGRALPACTDAERWARPTTWAVRKPGRVSALRVFDNAADAADLAARTPGGTVETRPGESVRCADYCAVSAFCPQWAALQPAPRQQEEAARTTGSKAWCNTSATAATPRSLGSCPPGSAASSPSRRTATTSCRLPIPTRSRPGIGSIRAGGRPCATGAAGPATTPRAGHDRARARFANATQEDRPMSARPTHDLVIKVGEYNDRETGETKARWLTIGTVFRHDEGGTSIKLDCLPVGLPEWNGWVSVFPRGDAAQQRRQPPAAPTRQPAPARAQPQPRQQQDFSDDIPF